MATNTLPTTDKKMTNAATTGLHGPFQLTFDGISQAVTRKSSGTFVLGHTDARGRFCINHVGRADDDVKKTLLDYIGSASMFKYSYFPLRAAFEKECELFHNFSPSGTRVHPGRPLGTNWVCPHCRIFASYRSTY